MNKDKTKKETSETAEQKRLEELEKRPMPQEGEAHSDWLKRIGGNNVEIVENLEEYQKPKNKEDQPLLIDSEGNFILNNKNIVKLYSEKDISKLEKGIELRVPQIKKFAKEGEYKIEKELFNQDPELCLKALVDIVRNNHKIVADKRFGESLDKWIKELKGEKVEEKPAATHKGKQAGPPKSEGFGGEGKEKTPTPAEQAVQNLDEMLVQAQKELEKAEQEAALYRPVGWFHKKPAVKSLNYYANEKRIEDLKKEIKELKAGKPAPAEGKEKPKKLSKVKEYLTQKAKKAVGGVKAKIKEEFFELKLEREALKESERKERELELIKTKKRLVEIDKILKKRSPRGIQKDRILSQPFFGLAREGMKLEKRLKKLQKKRKK